MLNVTSVVALPQKRRHRHVYEHSDSASYAELQADLSAINNRRAAIEARVTSGAYLNFLILRFL